MSYQTAFFTSIVALIPALVFCQQDYKGKVVDSETKEPLPYVNIGIFGKGIGTVSDEEGIFHLPIDQAQLTTTDIVQFSSMGYKTIEKTISDLRFVYNDYPEIPMEPKNLELNEIVVTNKGGFKVNDIVGYQNYGESTYGYWKDNIALGGELATKIKLKKGVRKLNTLFFEVYSNPSDSVLIRVNLYDLGKSKDNPGKNLNSTNSNILHTIYPQTKLAIVDLEPYSIYVKDDFIVSLELLKVYGEKPIGLILKASSEKGTYSLRKSASLGKWEVIPQSAMAYHLNTTYFSDKKKAESKVVKAQKSKQNISGFIFFARRPLNNIKVTNRTTNQETYSNEKGRYQILGEKDDIISFEAKGYKKMTIKLLEKNSININLIRE